MLGYRADIDGLRAVAVLSVLLFHVGIPVVPGGYTGVDVFFVISGFVITSGIVREFFNSKFSISSFYERRVRRILPALAASVAVTLVLFLGIMSGEDGRNFSKSAIAALFSVSNFYFWKTSGYFDSSSTLRPLLHTWSLAVEDQFYLFIPLVMQMTLRRSRGLATLVLAVAAAASFLLSVYFTGRAPSANFYALPTRAWELLVGCLLALHIGGANRNTRHDQWMSLAGIVLLAFAFLYYDGDTPFPGLAALPPTVGTALIIASGIGQRTFVSQVLATRPLVAIGAISYSLYLVHWPVIVFARFLTLQEPGLVQAAIICAVSIALAALSWKYIETPLRYPAQPLPRSRVFGGAAACVALVSVAALVGPSLLASKVYEPWKGEQIEAAAASEFKHPCFLENKSYTQWRSDECTRTTGAATNALLWGDSFAAHYVAGIMDATKIPSLNVMQYTASGCPPILTYHSYVLPYCQEFNRAALEVIKTHNIKVVILSARWDLLRGGRLSELQSTLTTLLSMGASVYVVGVSPEFPVAPKYLAYRQAGVGSLGDASWQINDAQWQRNEELKKIVSRSGATYIDVLSHLCSNHACQYMQAGKFLYMDYGHFSVAGSLAAVKCCFPLFRQEKASKTD